MIFQPRSYRRSAARLLTGIAIAANLSVYSTLTRAEGQAPARPARKNEAAAFIPLFKGDTFEGWRGFNREDMPRSGWTIRDGVVAYEPVGPDCDKPGDIMTVKQFSNFELHLEWKLAPGGNSGVKYLVDETLAPSGHSGLGFEMQILDDEKHPDAKKGTGGNRTAGALYDLIPPSKAAAKPPGEWNEAKLIVRGTHVEHWLNGERVVTFERGSHQLAELIAVSKYKGIAGFGQSAKGHILLQDHGDRVWYRNMRIRALKPDERTSGS